MRKRESLSGIWNLYYFKSKGEDVKHTQMLKDKVHISANVPGNVELDLAKSGIIKKELFKGMITSENEKLENWCWWYEKQFFVNKDDLDKRLTLHFGAVDCIADYYINGEKVYSSNNALMEICFEITDYVKAGSNVLHVHITPTVDYAYNKSVSQYMTPYCGEQSFVRKSAHSFGWDIFPRTISAGIWKDVYFEIDDKRMVKEFSYCVLSADSSSAKIQFHVITDIPREELSRNVYIKISASCKDGSFEHIERLQKYKAFAFCVDVETPYLWWPYGYGDANVYDLKYELVIDEEVCDSGTMNLGIRTVELKRRETLLENDHCFKFIINGVDIMCRGSNWVPLSPYHSMDKLRYEKALKLVSECNCNILRIWGGGVYEQEEFYDYCDKHGIMVWQDFMMACFIVSLEDDMLENIRREAKWAVCTLRHHPCIILWSGDNEIDETNALNKRRPGMNKITRDILPSVVEQNDNLRPYLASSPYISDKLYMEYGEKDVFPERHLWGPRDYYKSDYYKSSGAHFVSETGYHGAPCLESIKKTVDEDKIWPIFNEQWSLHSSDQLGRLHRVELMWNQIRQLFDFEAENIDDFICASQISQAEAKKYFIERVRIKKPYTSGIIWWNLLDGWPQMSDAVVDYFFCKKLAFDYIKRSQEPFVIMLDELNCHSCDVIASNDTLQEKTGTYKIYDIETEEIYAKGSFCVEANVNRNLSSVKMMYSEKRFLVIEWEVDGVVYLNHYLCGFPAFDFEKYKLWIKAFNKICKNKKD